MTEENKRKIRQLVLDFADSVESLQPTAPEVLTALAEITGKSLECCTVPIEAYVASLYLYQATNTKNS